MTLWKKSDLRAEARATVERDQVRIAVTVHCGSRARFTARSVRRVSLDGDVLDVYLREPDTPPEGHARCRLTSKPATEALEAGDCTTFEVSLHRPWRVIEPHADGSLDVRSFDPGKARTVRLHLLGADKPFYLNPKDADVRRQLRSWGEPCTLEVPLECP